MHQIRLTLAPAPTVTAERCRGDHGDCTGATVTISTPCGDLVLDFERVEDVEALGFAIAEAAEQMKRAPATNGTAGHA